MLLLLCLLTGVAGLAVGSFLNVVIYRVPAGLSVVRPRSSCPSCGAAIAARHNIPLLSWLVLRGRCANCSARISVRYPLVELSTAVLFVVAALFSWQREQLALLPLLWYVVAIGVALALIDIDVHRLPNVIVLPSYLVVAVLLAGGSAVSGDWSALLRALFGAAALFGAYLLMVLVYPAGMGWGDVKLAGVLGAVLGYFGWSAWAMGAFAGFVLGSLAAVVLMAVGRGSRKTALPFGPFMLAGTGVGVVWGEALGSWYLSLLL